MSNAMADALAAESPEVAADVAGDPPPKRKPGRPRKSTAKKRTSSSRGPPAGRLPPAAPRAKPLERKVRTWLVTVGQVVELANVTDGKAIQSGAPLLARGLCNVADQNPALKRFLERATSGGAYGELAIGAAVVLLPIAANHGLLPPRLGDIAAGLAGAPPVGDLADAEPGGATPDDLAGQLYDLPTDELLKMADSLGVEVPDAIRNAAMAGT